MRVIDEFPGALHRIYGAGGSKLRFIASTYDASVHFSNLNSKFLNDMHFGPSTLVQSTVADLGSGFLKNPTVVTTL